MLYLPSLDRNSTEPTAGLALTVRRTEEKAASMLRRWIRFRTPGLPEPTGGPEGRARARVRRKRRAAPGLRAGDRKPGAGSAGTGRSRRGPGRRDAAESLAEEEAPAGRSETGSAGADASHEVGRQHRRRRLGLNGIGKRRRRAVGSRRPRHACMPARSGRAPRRHIDRLTASMPHTAWSGSSERCACATGRCRA